MNIILEMERREETIVQKTIEEIEKEHEFQLQWIDTARLNSDERIDGELAINVKGKIMAFNAEVKSEIRGIHIKDLIELNKRFRPFILIAKRLYPNIRKQLRQNGINYLEANGNLYIKTPKHLLFIDAHAPIQEQRESGNRAFTKTGLQVLFQLLIEPGFVNAPQREIAKRAGVALGNIPRVIEGLLKSNYLLRYDEKTYQFSKIEELLHKWARDYENTLRPTLELGRYKLTANKPWQELELNPQNTYWGAEPAADILTNYLRPEILSFYTHLSKKEVMTQYRLMPASDGNIEVLKAFWPLNDNPPFGRIVHPLLVYVDLINTNEKRNTETAQRIFNEYIRPNL